MSLHFLEQWGYGGPGSAEAAWSRPPEPWSPDIDISGILADIRECRRLGRTYLAARMVVVQRLADDGASDRLEAKKLRLAVLHDACVDRAYSLARRLFAAGIGELVNEIAAEHSIEQRRRIDQMVQRYRARRGRCV